MVLLWIDSHRLRTSTWVVSGCGAHANDERGLRRPSRVISERPCGSRSAPAGTPATQARLALVATAAAPERRGANRYAPFRSVQPGRDRDGRAGAGRDH
jgi:hypothetical protein